MKIVATPDFTSTNFFLLINDCRKSVVIITLILLFPFSTISNFFLKNTPGYYDVTLTSKVWIESVNIDFCIKNSDINQI